MPLVDQDVGCRQLLAVDPVTGFGDCTSCGFHGKPLLHLAYSIGRAAGLNPARAMVYALGQTRYLTEAATEGKTRADVASTLLPTATATANRLTRAQQTATR